MSFDLPSPPNIPNNPVLTQYLWRLYNAVTQDRSSLARTLTLDAGTSTWALTPERIFSQEAPTESPDGSRVVFTTAPYRSGYLWVYRDQSVLIRGIDYTETASASGTFTLAAAPDSDEYICTSGVRA